MTEYRLIEQMDGKRWRLQRREVVWWKPGTWRWMYFGPRTIVCSFHVDWHPLGADDAAREIFDDLRHRAIR